MSYVTMSDLACCGTPGGLGQAPATITAATVNESAVEKLRRRLCEPVAIFAMIGAAAGAGLWLLTRGDTKANPRRNVIYGGMGNVRCIKCKQVKSYDEMAQAPGSAIPDESGQYYGLCKACHTDEAILRALFKESSRKRYAKKGAEAARKPPRPKAKKKRNDERKPPSITDLLRQTYDRQHSVRGGQAK